MSPDPAGLVNLILATEMLAELKKLPSFQPADHDKCVAICARVFGLTVEQVEFALNEADGRG